MFLILHRVTLFFTTSLLALYSFSSLASEEMPEHVSGITTVSASHLAEMITQSQPLTVIDARINKGRAKGFIEGSIHLPDVETNCDSLSNILKSDASKVVFYCSSSKCGRSLNAVTIAKKCGYTNLHWFRGGFKEWKESGYPYTK